MIDPQLGEFIKLLLAALTALVGAITYSKRQTKALRTEHVKKEKESAQRYEAQQKAIDDRQSDVLAKYVLLADQFKNMNDEEKERSIRLEKALEATRERLLQVQENSDLVIAGITKALQGLTVAIDHLAAQTKAYHDNLPAALAASVSDIAAVNLKGYNAGMAALGDGIKNNMDEIVDGFNRKMDERNHANGLAFQAMQKGLNDLKAEVVGLAKATHTEHENIRRDMLAKIDDLLNKLDAAKPPESPAKPAQDKPTAPTEREGKPE